MFGKSIVQRLATILSTLGINVDKEFAYICGRVVEIFRKTQKGSA